MGKEDGDVNQTGGEVSMIEHARALLCERCLVNSANKNIFSSEPLE